MVGQSSPSIRSGFTSPTTPTISATRPGDLIDRDAPADGAAARPEAPRQRLVDHDHRRRLRGIGIGQGAPRHQRNPHGAEVRGRDRTQKPLADAAPALGAGRPSTAKCRTRAEAGQGQDVHRAHRAHARAAWRCGPTPAGRRRSGGRRRHSGPRPAARGRSARPPAESRGSRCAAGRSSASAGRRRSAPPPPAPPP